MKNRTKNILYVALGVIIFTILYALKNTSYFLRSSTFIFSIVLFYFVDIFFKLNFKNIHYFIFLVISTTGVLFSPLYYLYPGYDKVLHFASPILICILVFFLVDKIENISFSMKLFITLSVVVSILSLWEIAEFSLDKLWGFQLQGVYARDLSGLSRLNIMMDRNDDTMIDLILGVIGSLLFVGTKTGYSYYQKLSLGKKLKKLLD